MKNKIQKKPDHKNDKQVANAVVAGVAGAVVVAGVAVAATMALKDKKTRNKFTKMLGDAKDQALDYLNKLQDEPMIEEGTTKVKEIAAGAKKTVKRNT